MLFTLAEEE